MRNHDFLLQEALEEFSDDEALRRFDAIEKKCMKRGLVSRRFGHFALRLDGGDKGYRRVTDQWLKAFKEIEDPFVKKLQSGEMVAEGLRYPVEPGASPVAIESRMWSFLVLLFTISAAEGSGVRFEGVTVTLASGATPSQHSQRTSEPGDESPSYRSPFVDLLLRAEQHFGERIREIKAQEIYVWLNEQGPKIDPSWSKNKTETMATFLRHPTQQKGGAKRANVRTNK